jgi:hypothetical protein
VEQVESVTQGVDRKARRQHDPPRVAPVGQHRRSADHHRQQQQVADRIREVGCDGQRSAPGGPYDAPEEEGGAERCRAHTRDHTVEPA